METYSNIVSGFLVITVCIPLLNKKIGMNRWYGFRFRKSFESNEHWYEINRYGARVAQLEVYKWILTKYAER